ncbi:MAG: dihydrofolate reductase [Bacteroidales bacterium]|jgi:dihydrofolate reductase|nr:dihydrofolate reductase [Bacteroidales bacterium]
MISAIVAIDENNAIGYNNQLLTHLPNDLKYFKRTTLGHPVIMGRNTYESLPVKPLPGRKNIIISKSFSEAPGSIVVSSIEDALEQCDDSEECFITGGMQIYRQMMPYVQKLYITRIHHRFEADVYFPDIDPDIWQLQSSERHETDEKHPYAYSFEVYLRK